MKKLLFVLALSGLFFACKKHEITATAPDRLAGFNQTALLQYLNDSVNQSAYRNFVNAMSDLDAKCSLFLMQANAQNLSGLQSSWKNAEMALKQVEITQFGPLAQNLYYSSLDRWPVRENDVEALLSSATPVDSALLTTKGTTVKGMPIIEYLLFSGDPLANFTTNANAEQRKNYVKAAVKNAAALAHTLSIDWDQYSATFLTQTGVGPSSSLTESLNAVINTCEVIKNKKVARPLGLIDGHQYPDEVEAPYSQQSLAAIRANLTAIRTCFTNNNGKGFNTLLDFVVPDQTLSKKVITSIDSCISRIDQITGPLSQSISTEESKVTALNTALTQLVAVLKGDVCKATGIPVLFSDLDGD